jgi:hypothetical protein
MYRSKLLIIILFIISICLITGCNPSIHNSYKLNPPEWLLGEWEDYLNYQYQIKINPDSAQINDIRLFTESLTNNVYTLKTGYYRFEFTHIENDPFPWVNSPKLKCTVHNTESGYNYMIYTIVKINDN